jgi:hypothetical protein
MAYTPAQITHAYGIDLVKFASGTIKGDGTGQTIAIVDAFDDPTILSDLQHFDATFGLPDPPSFQKAYAQGSRPAQDTGWNLEEALDVEWAHAIAPKANIVLVEAADSSAASLYGADVFAASLQGVSVVSNSWGSSEYASEMSADSNFIHSGVTFIFSAGDSGAPAGYASASPNVLSVGGTTLNLDSNGNWLSETGWSNGGGGPSQFEPKPSFQSGVTISSTRATPDVAFDGDPNTGVYVYDSKNGGWFQVGGTSLGAPAWAGLIAIVNQGRSVNGLGSINGSDLLTKIYQVSASDFHDITIGNNGYSAGPGYDFVTGRGSPIANLLIPDLVGTGTVKPPPAMPPTAPTGVSATAGDTQIVLAWSVSSGATSYNIYRSLTPGGEGSAPYRTGITSTTFTDTGLMDGTKYYYTITAVDSAGQSSQSAEVSAVPQKAVGSGSIRIDSGGGAVGSFISDTDYRGGHRSSTGHSIDTSGVSNPAPQSVYQTERYGNFTYTIPHLNPGVAYTVRLDFAEIYWNGPGMRLFNVNIGGNQVLTNFDVFAVAGGKYKAVAESFTAVADANGNITIQFITVRDNAMVSGIEILPAVSGTVSPHTTVIMAQPDHIVAGSLGLLMKERPDVENSGVTITGGAGPATAGAGMTSVMRNSMVSAMTDLFADVPHQHNAGKSNWVDELLFQLQL